MSWASGLEKPTFLYVGVSPGLLASFPSIPTYPTFLLISNYVPIEGGRAESSKLCYRAVQFIRHNPSPSFSSYVSTDIKLDFINGLSATPVPAICCHFVLNVSELQPLHTLCPQQPIIMFYYGLDAPSP